MVARLLAIQFLAFTILVHEAGEVISTVTVAQAFPVSYQQRAR